MNLEVNREITRLFIVDDPSLITLTPSSKEKAPSGGYREVKGEPKPIQMVKIIYQSAKGDADSTSDGAVRKHRVVIVGLYGANIEEGDTFEWPENSGSKWVVTGIHPDNGYEVKADAIAYGIGDRDG